LVGVLQAFAVYTVGFIARRIGAPIFGHYGDRIGRKAALITTLLPTGLATFAVGFVPTYEPPTPGGNSSIGKMGDFGVPSARIRAVQLAKPGTMAPRDPPCGRRSSRPPLAGEGRRCKRGALSRCFPSLHPVRITLIGDAEFVVPRHRNFYPNRLIRQAILSEKRVSRVV